MSDFDKTLTRENLLRQMDLIWNELQTFLASLTHEQLTRPTDAGGWTVKDHLIHLALLENTQVSLLGGKSRHEVLGFTRDVWERLDGDGTNAVIQQRYHDMALDQVMQKLRQTREHTLKKLAMLTQEDLLLPYHHYQPNSTEERPIIMWLMAETVKHYHDHMPWMKAIVEKT
jgi:hypothetical protein